MLGRRLKELRGKRTQQEIADKLDISRARYSHYENEHVQPDNELIQKIADVYNVSVDYLLGRSNAKNVISNNNDLAEKHPAEKLRDMIEEGLTDEQIKERMDFMVDIFTLNDEQIKEFMGWVRYQLSKKKQPSGAPSEHEDR